MEGNGTPMPPLPRCSMASLSRSSVRTTRCSKQPSPPPSLRPQVAWTYRNSPPLPASPPGASSQPPASNNTVYYDMDEGYDAIGCGEPLPEHGSDLARGASDENGRHGTKPIVVPWASLARLR